MSKEMMPLTEETDIVSGKNDDCADVNKIHSLRKSRVSNLYERIKSHVSYTFLLFDGGLEESTLCSVLVCSFAMVIGLGFMNSFVETVPSFTYKPTTCPNPACQNSTLCPGTMICAPEPWQVFDTVEIFVVIIFTIEYGVRFITVWAVTSREAGIAPFDWDEEEKGPPPENYPFWEHYLRFTFLFKNMIDAATIFPAYALMGSRGQTSTTFLRVFRLLRVFKLAARFKNLQQMFLLIGETLKKSMPALSVLVLFSFMGMIFFGSLIYSIEGGTFTVNEDYPQGAFLRFNIPNTELEVSPYTSIPTSIYWVITTATTVGFGDLVPTSWLGRALAAVVMYSGVVVLALPVGVIGSNFAEAYKDFHREMKKRKEAAEAAEAAAAEDEAANRGRGGRRKRSKSMVGTVILNVGESIKWIKSFPPSPRGGEGESDYDSVMSQSPSTSPIARGGSAESTGSGSVSPRKYWGLRRWSGEAVSAPSPGGFRLRSKSDVVAGSPSASLSGDYGDGGEGTVVSRPRAQFAMDDSKKSISTMTATEEKKEKFSTMPPLDLSATVLVNKRIQEIKNESIGVERGRIGARRMDGGDQIQVGIPQGGSERDDDYWNLDNSSSSFDSDADDCKSDAIDAPTPPLNNKFMRKKAAWRNLMKIRYEMKAMLDAVNEQLNSFDAAMREFEGDGGYDEGLESPPGGMRKGSRRKSSSGRRRVSFDDELKATASTAAATSTGEERRLNSSTTRELDGSAVFGIPPASGPGREGNDTHAPTQHRDNPNSLSNFFKAAMDVGVDADVDVDAYETEPMYSLDDDGNDDDDHQALALIEGPKREQSP